MDLKIIHDTLRFYLDKFQMGWYADEDIDNILDRAQMQYFNNLRPGYGMSQMTHDSLLPFKAQYIFTNGTSVDGLITLPTNYESLITVETVVMDGSVIIYPTVDLLNEAQISERKSSQLVAISTKYPAGLLLVDNTAGKVNKFQIYPAQPNAGTVYYFRRPVAPIFIYTESGRTITYDQDNSTQMEWDDMSIEKIIFITLGLLGINLQADEVIQIADGKEKSIA